MENHKIPLFPTTQMPHPLSMLVAELSGYLPQGHWNGMVGVCNQETLSL